VSLLPTHRYSSSADLFWSDDDDDSLSRCISSFFSLPSFLPFVVVVVTFASQEDLLPFFGDEGENGDGDGEGDGSSTTAAAAATTTGAHHCLVLLDCGRTMFEPSLPYDERRGHRNAAAGFAIAGAEKEGQTTSKISPHDWSLLAFDEIVRQRVERVVLHKTGRRDGFGVLLFNTRNRTKRQQPRAFGYHQADDSYYAGAAARDGHAAKEEEEGAGRDQGGEDDDEEYGPTKVRQHEFLPLEAPGLRTLEAIAAAQDNLFCGRQFDVEAEYGRGVDDEDDEIPRYPPIQLAILEATKIFDDAKCVKKPGGGADRRRSSRSAYEERDSKQVWIITDDDDPLASCRSCGGAEGASSNRAVDPAIKKRRRELLDKAKKVVDDARQNDIDVYVWPLSSTVDRTNDNSNDKPFRSDLFYGPVGAKAPVLEDDEDGEAGTPPALDVDNMVDHMLRDWKKTRRAFTLPVLLPDWDSSSDSRRSKREGSDGGNGENVAMKMEGEEVDSDDISKLGIWCDWYHLIQPKKPPTNVKIHSISGK